MVDYASNLRRLMAQQGLTLDQVIERTGLSEGTVKTLLAGVTKPHARTLHRIARGLNVSTDELFQDPSLLAHRLFDRATNPVVDEVIGEQASLFAGWSEYDFDELYSRFGHGGALTADGVVTTAAALNRKRELRLKVELLLDSPQREVLAGILEVLYEQILMPSVRLQPKKCGDAGGESVIPRNGGKAGASSPWQEK